MLIIVTRALLAILLLVLTACQQSPEQARQQLGRLDIQFDSEVFIDSIRRGDDVVVKLFLASGMDPNTEVRYANDEDTERSEIGEELRKFLQEAGIDFRTRGTVLHLAARLKLPLIVEILLDAGADTNAEDNAEKRAIDYVDEQTEVYELLR